MRTIVQSLLTADARCDKISENIRGSRREYTMRKPKYVAIVEDDAQYRDTIKRYLEQYTAENNREIKMRFFINAKMFVKEYRPDYDLILMDIELPDGNGLDVIRKLREKDKDVLVIFVTNMAQYAVAGYEVDAFDFIVKPVSYFNFSVKLKRALDRLDMTEDTDFWVNAKTGKVRIRTKTLKYVEVMKHKVLYHTTDGVIETSGSMKNAIELLKNEPFGLCNRCYLVNFLFVEEVRKYTITVGGEELLMSHLKRDEFLRKLNMYLSGDGGDDT